MAKPFFNFSGKAHSEQTVRNTWDELRTQLRDGLISYDDREVITKNRFMAAINSIFSNDYGKQFISKPLEHIANEYHLIRGSVIQPAEPFPNYDRMLPKSEFINYDNRFSPKGIEWLYLALGCKCATDGKEDAIICSQKECRAEKGQQFAICEFQYKSNPLKVIDLTIADHIPFEQLESQLEEKTQRLKQDEINRIMLEMKRKHGALDSKTCLDILLQKDIPKANKQQEFQHQYIEWCVYTYAKILSEQLFIPVESADKELMYAPFHCIAQYFLSLGYSGIVYKSTVYEKGKNLVLFDKTLVKPVGDIDLRIIP